MTKGESHLDTIARLENEVERLKRINNALMDRVERGLSSGASAFGVFERAMSLEEAVAQRTRDLAVAKELAEAQAQALKQQAVELEKARAETEEAMQQFKTASLKAEQATRSKSEFLANMSHEIRTPMTAILGFTETMLDPDQSPSDRFDAIHAVRRNGEHLLQIINDILDISKIEAGKLEVEHIKCSPILLVASVRDLMSIRAEQKNLPFDTLCEGEIPETIQTDPRRLKQILVNLIGNAIKFTESGQIQLVVRFVDQHSHGEGEPSQPMLQLDVTDSGIGMTTEQIGRLFQPFSQADTSTTRKFGGTGLGLMISKRLAETLGGDISIESSVGEGSLFRVCVATGPLEGVRMLNNPAIPTCIHPEGPTSVPTTNEPIHCRILLAEDNPTNQLLVTKILEKAGATITAVGNGQLAIESALAAASAGQPFDVILMDMQMPVMDGYEATEHLRQKGYTAPVIALTAHAMVSDRQKCIAAGCNDYATKPINQEALIDTIRQYLPQHAANTTH